MKKVLAVALAVTAALALNGAALQADEMLNGAGATFPYPVYSAWANEYIKITGVILNYQSIGSNGGIKQVTERTVDFGASKNRSNLKNLPRQICSSSRRSSAAWFR